LLHVDPEPVEEPREPTRQSRAAHGPVVGVHRDAEAELVEQVERVVLHRRAPGRDRSRAEVRRRRQLERDLAVAHPTREVAEAHPHLVALLCDPLEVLRDPHAVSEAQGAAVEQGRADRVEPGRLARVQRDGEELGREEVERLAVARRREAVLRPREVEADHAVVAEVDREPRDLERALALAHRREDLPDADRVAALVGRILALLEPVLHGLHGLLEREALASVLLGRPAHLAVDDAVVREILDELARDPRERLGGLHDGDRQLEGLEVLDERVRRGLLGEPLPQLARRAGGQVEARLDGELEHGRGAHAAVEVVVQRDLRQAADGHAVDGRLTAGGAAVLLLSRHAGLRASGGGQAVILSRTIGAASGAVSPISYAPARASSARSNRPASSAFSVASGWPARTASPGFACRSMPAAWTTGSVARARPAPRRHAAIPTSYASRRWRIPSRSAVTTCVSRGCGRGASGSPSCARIMRRHVSMARPSRSASAGSASTPARRSISRARATVSSTTSAGPPPASTSTDSRTSLALPTARPRGVDMSVRSAVVFTPESAPSATMVRARDRKSVV